MSAYSNFSSPWPSNTRKTKRDLMLRITPAGNFCLCLASSLCLLKIVYQGGLLHLVSLQTKPPAEIHSVVWLIPLPIPLGDSMQCQEQPLQHEVEPWNILEEIESGAILQVLFSLVASPEMSNVAIPGCEKGLCGAISLSLSLPSSLPLFLPHNPMPYVYFSSLWLPSIFHGEDLGVKRLTAFILVPFAWEPAETKAFCGNEWHPFLVYITDPGFLLFLYFFVHFSHFWWERKEWELSICARPAILPRILATYVLFD